MYKFHFIIAFSFLTLFAWSQQKYEGVIYDVGTREVLGDVLVESLNTGRYAQTDALGYFNIELYPQSLEDETLEHFSFFNNTIYWNLNSATLINIYSLSGTKLLSTNLPSQGSLLLDVPISGYYILNMSSDNQRAKFLLASDGSNYRMARKKNFSNINPLQDSCLLFSKPEYFGRAVSLGNTEEFEHFNLLKKKYDDLDYFQILLRHEAYYMLHASPPSSNFGEVQAIKVLHDFVEDEIYYSNIKKHHSHFRFAQRFLDYEFSQVNFFYSQYGIHPNRYLNLVSINYHENIDKYVFEFASTDMVDCAGIKMTYDKLMESSFFGEKLYFYANNLRWSHCLDIPIISSAELYLGQNYQALNLEENYGYLRKVSINELPTSYLGRHDLVLLNGVPNDLSVVSGIITTEFQTALSHINILSHNRKTPNMALKNGWTSPRLDSLLGELVYLKVESDSFIIRKANIEEANAFWFEKEPQTPITLEIDTTTSGLIELSDADILWVETIGGKAANFAELVYLDSIPLPENYFAIPFYYYQQHINNNGLDTIINQMLTDEIFISNLEYREAKLNELKDLIINSPLDPVLFTAVTNRLHHFIDFSSFRFRSSTNAEDLETFSGAGLYDSYSAKKDHETKTVDRAIKKVWASLWNLRAFDERDYFKINQYSIAMGILVHRSFPDEDANGVILTKNIYNTADHAYTINVQYKEYSIVYPEPGIIHDQILVHTISLDGQDYTIEYLSQSNIPELGGQTVLSDEELYEIADYCTMIKHHYFENISNNNNGYESFAVDIEFKVDSQLSDRKIYIKQARIYGSY